MLAQMHKTWLEVALNGPWGRARQPGIPVRVEDIVAVRRGGHLRVGLEDAPLGSERSNLEWVRAGRRAIELAGGELASADEVRAALS